MHSPHNSARASTRTRLHDSTLAPRVARAASNRLARLQPSRLASHPPPPSDKTPPYAQIAPAPSLCFSEVTDPPNDPTSPAPPLCSCILTRSLRSILKAPLLAKCSPDAAPVPPPNRAQVPAANSNQTTLIATPQWLLLRPSLSRCAFARAEQLKQRPKTTNTRQCVVTGDGAVGKVRCSFPQRYFGVANNTDMSPHLIHHKRLPGRIHPHSVSRHEAFEAFLLIEQLRQLLGECHGRWQAH